MFGMLTVPEEQEVSIEYVVDSVVAALVRNRAAQNEKLPGGQKLPPFNINIEVDVPLSYAITFV